MWNTTGENTKRIKLISDLTVHNRIQSFTKPQMKFTKMWIFFSDIYGKKLDY